MPQTTKRLLLKYIVSKFLILLQRD